MDRVEQLVRLYEDAITAWKNANSYSEVVQAIAFRSEVQKELKELGYQIDLVEGVPKAVPAKIYEWDMEALEKSLDEYKERLEEKRLYEETGWDPDWERE